VPRRSKSADTTNQSFRAEDAAFEVVRIVGRKRPEVYAAFIDRVQSEPDHDSKVALINEWCDSLNLPSDEVKMAVLHLAHDPNDGPAGEIRIRVPRDPDNRPGRVEPLPGETQTAFLERAKAAYDRVQDIERQSGGVISQQPVNRRHLEWFVQFQVNGVNISDLATSDSMNSKDIRRAIQAVAVLLEMSLRPSRRGRPPGRKNVKEGPRPKK
jgi:hypothetical protein